MVETRRGSRLPSLLSYLRRLMLSGYTGRIQITVDFHRGGISNAVAFKLEKDADLWR